jgi:predicted DNA-binding transcriptional regulator AlpA
VRQESVPTLDELASEPARAASLSAEARSRLLVQIAAILTVLGTPLPESSPQVNDRLLKVDEAGARLGVSVDFMYRHAAKLPFAVRQGRSLRFSEQGIERYIRQRHAR